MRCTSVGCRWLLGSASAACLRAWTRTGRTQAARGEEIRLALNGKSSCVLAFVLNKCSFSLIHVCVYGQDPSGKVRTVYALHLKCGCMICYVTRALADECRQHVQLVAHTPSAALLCFCSAALLFYPYTRLARS
jgi:hypothetical protein